MSMLHLRVVCPADRVDDVHDTLCSHVGAVAVRIAGECSDGVELTAAVARESVDDLLDALREKKIDEHGLISTEPLDTTIGALAERAERDAPGEGADALIWDELAARGREDSTLTGTFLAFMVLATVLAAIGVVTNSQITIVGAMVVGPEFGPLAAVAIGTLRRDVSGVRRAVVALGVGFPVALVVTALLALAARAVGLIHPADLTSTGQVDFIYHPGWFSLITAVVAGTAGMLSLTSSKSAALVGVFISITTIPAAGNAAVGVVLGSWHETWLSLAQLAINMVGILGAALLTLIVMNRAWTVAHAQRPASAEAHAGTSH